MSPGTACVVLSVAKERPLCWGPGVGAGAVVMLCAEQGPAGRSRRDGQHKPRSWDSGSQVAERSWGGAGHAGAGSLSSSPPPCPP